jgi:hypothetical protein
MFYLFLSKVIKFVSYLQKAVESFLPVRRLHLANHEDLASRSLRWHYT